MHDVNIVCGKLGVGWEDHINIFHSKGTNPHSYMGLESHHQELSLSSKHPILYNTLAILSFSSFTLLLFVYLFPCKSSL
jgi:hypothetical protein